MKSFIIYEFMVKDLKLKGFSLMIYAIIHSFTSLGQSCFIGQSKFADLLGCSIKQVNRCINSLIAKNLIGFYNNSYFVIKKTESDHSISQDDIEECFDWESMLNDLGFHEDKMSY